MSASTVSPRSARLASLLVWLATASPGWCGDLASLPVFLAETFGWITRMVDLDAPHILVLIDAHSDASAAERSEDLREQVRRVPSFAARAARVEGWRTDGRLQVFNWIEPLMPRPVERVLWFPAPEGAAETLLEHPREAVAYLDGRLEVEPRSAGSFAGDIVLAGEEHIALPGFGRGGADLFLANLEGIPSMREGGKAVRYDFRFPPERLAFLKEHGVDAVSLANNHALDAGPEGLVEGLDTLQSASLPSFGAGKDESEACRPWRVERQGVTLAVFGASLLPGDEAEPTQPGVATLPKHQSLLAAAMREARSRSERIVVLVHGGDEYRHEVNEDQRRWTRWLVAHGAVAVAGAHPHVAQREERHGGATVLHSLGNAVYPRELKGADSGAVRVVELP